MLFRTENGVPVERYTVRQLKKDAFESTSTLLPEDIKNIDLSRFNAMWVEPGPRPSVGPEQRAVLPSLPQLVNGEYVLEYTVEDIPVQEREDDVQRATDRIMQDRDELVAIALATVDLVMAANNGQIDGLTKAQVRSAYRDRILATLRNRRGL